MISLDIPGAKTLALKYLVLDYNGTIACDGELLPGVKDAIEELSRNLSVFVVTADTYGSVQNALKDLPCQTILITKGNQAQAKANSIRQLGASHCVSVGNGRNDALMLKEAALGIAVIQTEGAAAEALGAADVVTHNILDALDLLRRPLRLTATLRR